MKDTKKFSAKFSFIGMLPLVCIFLFLGQSLAAQSITLQMYNDNRNPNVNTLYPNFKITNNGTTSVNLSTLKIRYYYTNDGTTGQDYSCDYASNNYVSITSYITDSETSITPPQTGADSYVEIGFTGSAGNLAPGNYAEIKGRIINGNWNDYTQTNDYSFNPTSDNYVTWDKATAYISGALVWGTEPAASSLLSYEAETGTLSGSAQIVNNYVCSLGTQGTSEGSVRITVDVPTTGNYILTTVYSCSSTLDFNIDINEDVPPYKRLKIEIHNLIPSGQPAKTLIPLVAGINTIEYYNEDEQSPNLDKITLEPADVAAPDSIILEAENAILTGYVYTGGSEISSNEQRVLSFSKDNFADNAIIFNADIKHGGEYVMSVYYVCRADRNVYYKVNNGTPFGLTGLNSGGHDTITKQDVRLTLASGTNTFTFYSNSTTEPTPDIDRIILSEVLEAESGTRSGSAGVFNDPFFSGGARVCFIGNNEGYMTLPVEAPAEGYYTLTLYYTCADTRAFFVQANTDDPVKLNYCNSGSWVMANKEIDVHLNTGSNTLKFFNNDGWCPDLDLITMRYKDQQGLKRVYGEHVMLHLERPDYANITEDNLTAWLQHLDTAYNYYTDLVVDDDPASTYEPPFNGRIIEIRSFHMTWGYAGSGNPIYWSRSQVPNGLLQANGGNWLFGILHEMGHDFDLGYIEYDPIANKEDINGWNFDGEFWANFKMYYIAANEPDAEIDIYQGSALKNLYKTNAEYSYANTIGNPVPGAQSFHHDGLTWCFIRMIEGDSVLLPGYTPIGWGPFLQTFKEFANSQYNPRGRLPKFDLFMERLAYNAEKTDWNDAFLPGELEFIREGIAVSNAQFELKYWNNSKYNVSDWQTNGTSIATFSSENKTELGSRAAKITLNSSGDAYYYINRYDENTVAELLPNTAYELKVRVFTDTNGNASASAFVMMENDPTPVTTPAAFNHGITEITKTFTTGPAPAGCNTILCEVRLILSGTSGTVWFDDLQFTKL